MARLMKLRWAAGVHHIPLQDLINELNECADASKPGASGAAQSPQEAAGRNRRQKQ
jgi:hypothetical protein